MDRSQKEEQVKEIAEIFDNSGSVVMAEYSGMTVAEMTELRAKLREQGASIRVVKNRLAKIAMKGKPFEAAGDMMRGPVAQLNLPKIAMHSLLKVGLWVKKSSVPMALWLCPSCHLAKSLLEWLLPVAQRLMSPGSALSGAIAVIEEKAAA